jgi:hypothetical protein
MPGRCWKDCDTGEKHEDLRIFLRRVVLVVGFRDASLAIDVTPGGLVALFPFLAGSRIMTPDQPTRSPSPADPGASGKGDPEHLMSFENILCYTVPIVSVGKKDFSMGSGVLVTIDGRLFVATAWHCIAAHPVVLVDGMELRYCQSVPVPPQPRIRILRSGGDRKIDVGFLELEGGKAIRTQIDHQPCALNHLHAQPIPTRGSDGGPNPMHVVGWPRFSQDIQGESLFRTLEGFITTCTGRDETYLYYPFGDRGFQWDEGRGGWEEKATPDPVGFSGGGCWGILKSAPDALYDPTRHIRLLAIQSEWDYIKRVAKAVLIAKWVTVVYAHLAEVRPCLEGHFPDMPFPRSEDPHG